MIKKLYVVNPFAVVHGNTSMVRIEGEFDGNIRMTCDKGGIVPDKDFLIEHSLVHWKELPDCYETFIGIEEGQKVVTFQVQALPGVFTKEPVKLKFPEEEEKQVSVNLIRGYGDIETDCDSGLNLGSLKIGTKASLKFNVTNKTEYPITVMELINNAFNQVKIENPYVDIPAGMTKEVNATILAKAPFDFKRFRIMVKYSLHKTEEFLHVIPVNVQVEEGAFDVMTEISILPFVNIDGEEVPFDEVHNPANHVVNIGRGTNKEFKFNAIVRINNNTNHPVKITETGISGATMIVGSVEDVSEIPAFESVKIPVSFSANTIDGINTALLSFYLHENMGDFKLSPLPVKIMFLWGTEKIS